MADVTEIIQVEKKLFRIINDDAIKTAEVEGLEYVNSNDPGFTGIRKGKEFMYMDGNIRLRDPRHTLSVSGDWLLKILGSRSAEY